MAVVPARNEAKFIGETIRSLIVQGVQVVLVDDSSSDGTSEAAAQQDVIVISGKPLAESWTGKLWALSQGVAEALKLDPDYLLFTDADILHKPDSVQTLVGIAEARKLDMCSLMVQLHCADFAERALIPAFVYFFLQLYPPNWVASTRHQIAGAAGGCVLIRPRALERIGGLAALKGQIIDDCSLASLVKDSGGAIWMGLTKSAVSLTAVWRIQRDRGDDFKECVQPVAPLGVAADCDRVGAVGHLRTAAIAAVFGEQDSGEHGCAGLAADERELLANGSVLQIASCLGVGFAGCRGILPGRDSAFGSALLAGKRRRMERPCAGPLAVPQQHLQNAALSCFGESGGSLVKRIFGGKHAGNVDLAGAEKFDSGFKASASGTDQGDLVDDYWSSIERDFAVDSRLHDHGAAWPHHANGLMQTFGRTGGVDNDVVSGTRMVLRVTCFSAGALCNRKLAGMAAVDGDVSAMGR